MGSETPHGLKLWKNKNFEIKKENVKIKIQRNKSFIK